MDASKYDRYLEITNLVSSLEQEKKILNKEILEHLVKEKAERVIGSIGIISLKSRSTWKYAESVKSKIEILQKEAQESGEAEKQESTYLSTSIK